MQCANCQRQWPDDFKVCPICAAPLGAAAAAAAGGVAVGQDVHGGITVVNRAAPAESAPGGGGNVADEPGTSLGAVRDLLLDAFSAEELRGLFLYAESPALRPATYEFGPNEGVGAMADEAILFCHRRGLLPDLLAEVERARPEKFKLYAARLRGEG